MVVDTSIITAIVTVERERDLFVNLLLRIPALVMSVVSVVETSLVLRTKRLDYEAGRLDQLLSEFRIDVRDVDAQQGRLAREAFARFGKGRHPARLNFGDCFPYALAKARDDSLLYKGDDFARTDIAPAWRPEGSP